MEVGAFRFTHVHLSSREFCLSHSPESILGTDKGGKVGTSVLWTRKSGDFCPMDKEKWGLRSYGQGKVVTSVLWTRESGDFCPMDKEKWGLLCSYGYISSLLTN